MPARLPHSSRFDADWLAAWLAAQPGYGAATKLCVAWSGGADSTALIHALVQLRDHCRTAGRPVPVVCALHIDHGLQPAAAGFARQCRRLAKLWQLPLQVRRVRVPVGPGISVEQAARQVRYAALAAQLRPGQWLLTAQHAEDQLETVLLQALRGAGAAGLAGMAPRAPLGQGELLRPLLGVPRQSLLDYLRREGVAWSEDPSNTDLRFDRNHLRNVVLPPLLARWPAAARTVARGARLAAEADAMATAQAQRDWQAAADGVGLALPVLRRYPVPRQRALLRAWLQSQGVQVPDEQRLEALRSMADLRQDAMPVLRWGAVEARRHGDRLVVLSALQPVQRPATLRWDWRRLPRLSLPGGAMLRLQREVWGDVDLAKLPALLQVRWRSGGQRIMAGGLQRDIKSLLREAQLPAWQRDAVPLLFADTDVLSPVLAVADLVVADTLAATTASTDRGRFIWQQD